MLDSQFSVDGNPLYKDSTSSYTDNAMASYPDDDGPASYPSEDAPMCEPVGHAIVDASPRVHNVGMLPEEHIVGQVEKAWDPVVWVLGVLVSLWIFKG